MFYAYEKKNMKRKYSCYECYKFICKNHIQLIYDSCLEGEKSGNKTSDTI